jgi:hypothetical protein
MYKTMLGYELTTYQHDILTTTPQTESITSLLSFLPSIIFCGVFLLEAMQKETTEISKTLKS